MLRMLRTLSVVVLALTMSVGLAEARFRHHHQVVPPCTPGPAAAMCACGTASGHRLFCHPGQWCHTDQACTA
jgi:hypothetical protein